MAEPGDSDPDSSAAERTSNTFMVAAIVFLFIVVVFVFFLYLYSTRRLRRLRRLRRARILVFSASDLGASSSICRGLDASVLRSLPVAVYRAAEFGNGIECAVCLCELADGEAVRILSKCGHGFHVECIDMWFHSHSTCPLCRSPVGAEPIPAPNSNPLAGSEALNPDSPVFQSNRPQTIEAPSSSSARLKKPKGDLAIEIPRREPERFSSPVSQLPTSRNARDETRTPGSGMLPAVRRRWSMAKRTPTPGSGSACSPMGGDLEQGFGRFYGERSTPPAKSPADSRLETTRSHELPK